MVRSDELNAFDRHTREVRAIAGSGGDASSDGDTQSASFAFPNSLSLCDTTQRLFISDTSALVVRILTLSPEWFAVPHCCERDQ